MELPKNITQIGEVGRDCKIYVEDYVISYMKQLNPTARDKGITLALYGRHREEGGVSYFFLYGACRITSLQREVRHLSQAQRQEIESLRRKYFPEYDFLGYRMLNGEMVEGFHICEQEICRYIAGYAQFYEKNDSMLAYMLAIRDEIAPEQFDQGKYDEVKRRQEERREAASRMDRSRRVSDRTTKSRKKTLPREPASGRVQGMRVAAAGIFVMLCLLGLIGLQDSADGEDIKSSAGQWLAEIKDSARQDTPDEIVATSAGAQKDTLVLEDKLEQALREENNPTRQPEAEPADKPEPETEETVPADEADKSGTEPADVAVAAPGEETKPDAVSDKPDMPEAEPEPAEEKPAVSTDVKKAPESVAYVVRHGDTLTGISVRQYGSDRRVNDICSLNKISDPDDIKEGQIIMLPK